MSESSLAGRVVGRIGEIVVERDPLRPTGRLLLQGDMESSYVDLADPRHLEFDYMRWLRFVIRAARARRVLHLGGGACALARVLAIEDPGGRQEVCELDANVLEAARQWMGLRPAPGLKVRNAEAREFLAGQPRDGWDAIVIDAFQGAVVPRRLITVEALTEVARWRRWGWSMSSTTARLGRCGRSLPDYRSASGGCGRWGSGPGTRSSSGPPPSSTWPGSRLRRRAIPRRHG